jgi:hypothetical protein
MTISPINIINENVVEFYLHGKSFTIDTNESTITENDKISDNLMPLAWALENFQFSNNAIVWYKGASKMVYKIQENKFYLGNTEILDENFAEYVMSTGTIRYEEKSIAKAFENAANNIDKYITLDFVKTVNENENLVDIMKVGENIYISRINETAKIYNFFKANNANAALEFVAEKTNVDVTDFLAESLEGEAAERAKLLSTISEKTDIINFLKDQRGLLAEADRSIEEIKAADALIEGEIERFENEVKELQSEL